MEHIFRKFHNGREYLDNVPLFQGCEEKFLDAVSVLLREMQVTVCTQALIPTIYLH